MDVIGHFGLAQDPFRATIEPDQAFQSRPFSIARQQVLAGLVRGARLIAIAGGTGAGKTLLLRDLERAIAGRQSVRTERPDTAHAALSSPAEVLLIDDADTIDDATFATLIDRTTLPGGPAVVLACAQRCLDRLPAALGPLTVPLPFLGDDEARAFLVDRVTRAGGNAALFDPDALDILADASRGIPAALRQLGAAALFQAAFDGQRHIEANHARQAAAMTQDMWRGVVAPEAANRPISAARVPPPVEVAAPPPIAPVAPPIPQRAAFAAAAAAPAIAAERLSATEAAYDDPPARRGWWRGAPPLVRLAMVVGLLLLSLPVIGYVVGAVKDERPAADSSYLPDDADAEAEAAPPEGELADASNPDIAPIEVAPAEALPADDPVGTARAPEDLTASTRVPDAEPVPEAPPVLEPEPPAPEPREEAVAAVEDEPLDLAPASGGARVFVHYSTQQPGADEAAAQVARELRERGFAVADIRAVRSRIETASVRYFFADDRAHAEALHDALGATLRGRGFSAGDLKSMTGYRPSPRRGTLEVWVPVG